jgi:exodeoxyribonuclease V alpha subunit
MQESGNHTYCVGDFSFPGEQIKLTRRLEWETRNAGKPCARLDGIPPCVYSINAFGKEPITGYSDPPDWYPTEERLTWEMLASTVCIWPYEQMYREEVNRFGSGQKYDYDKRIAFAKDYFSQIEPNRSLVFYYANYSNPFSEEDARRYVLVGVSRVKSLGKVRYYDDMTEEARSKYGGGFVWALDLTSLYPDEGLRLPYHVHLDDPAATERFLVTPPNPRHFKYATRQLSDDDALELVERLIESVGALQELGDTTEDWTVRAAWLHSVLGELWTQRGIFPGMPAVLEHLGMARTIGYFKDEVAAGNERAATSRLLGVAEGSVSDTDGLDLSVDDVKGIRRAWNLLDPDEQRLVRDVLVRFELTKDQVARILSTERAQNGITASISGICENLYVLSEQFVGSDTDDVISFTRIDHGMLPSPELGGERLADADDSRRLRSLIVERLKSEQADVFLPAAQVIHEVNHRLSFHHEWKRHQFTERYVEADREELEGALVLRQEKGAMWLYLRNAHEDERLVEQVPRELASRKAITLTTPMTSKHWEESLRDPNSPLETTTAKRSRARRTSARRFSCSHCASWPARREPVRRRSSSRSCRDDPSPRSGRRRHRRGSSRPLLARRVRP